LPCLLRLLLLLLLLLCHFILAFHNFGGWSGQRVGLIFRILPFRCPVRFPKTGRTPVHKLIILQRIITLLNKNKIYVTTTYSSSTTTFDLALSIVLPEVFFGRGISVKRKSARGFTQLEKMSSRLRTCCLCVVAKSKHTCIGKKCLNLNVFNKCYALLIQINY
jgi:hypothetical protein